MAKKEINVPIAVKDKYSKELAKARKLFNSTGKNILTTFKGGAVAVAGFSAVLGLMIKKTADAGDGFHKMSLRTGMSSQALSELAHAAELSGTSIETVENGLRLLSGRMLDVRDGSAEATRTFEDLGITVTTSSGDLRAADAVFMDAVAAINNLGSETEKTAYAQDLFGRSGTQLLPLLRAGKEGIAAMREEAQRLGITFDSKAAASAAAFADELTRTKAAISGVSNTIALEFMPYATSIASAINEQFIELRTSGAMQRWANDAADTAFNTFQSIAMGAAGMTGTISPIIRGAYGEVQFLWEQFEALPSWAKELGILGVFIGGKKGVALLGMSLYLLGTFKNSMRGFQEMFNGSISLMELASMNAGELAIKLKEIDEATAKRHALGIFTKEELEALKSEGSVTANLLDPGKPEEYAAKVEAIFSNIREKIDELKSTTPLSGALQGTLGGKNGKSGGVGGDGKNITALNQTLIGQTKQLDDQYRRLNMSIEEYNAAKMEEMWLAGADIDNVINFTAALGKLNEAKAKDKKLSEELALRKEMDRAKKAEEAPSPLSGQSSVTIQEFGIISAMLAEREAMTEQLEILREYYATKVELAESAAEEDKFIMQGQLAEQQQIDQLKVNSFLIASNLMPNASSIFTAAMDTNNERRFNLSKQGRR